MLTRVCRTVLFLGALALSGCAWAAPPHWVSPTGAASWAQAASRTPLAGKAACSLATANASARAGDIVYLRGGTYATGLAPANSGTRAARITFRRHAGEIPRISGVPEAVSFTGRSYVTVEGITADAVDRFVSLRRSDHIWVLRCTFRNPNNAGGWPTGISLLDSSHHNRLAQITVGGVGYANDKPDDIGGVMVVGDWSRPEDRSDYNLIEDSVLYRGGHHIMEVSSSHNIIRNNYFHNENWMRTARPETGNLAGNRALIIEHNSARLASWNVIEGNRIACSAPPPDGDTVSGVSLRTPHNIVRRNLFYGNDGPGLDFYTDARGAYDAPDNRVYHNVFYHNGFTALPMQGSGVRYTAGLLIENVSGSRGTPIRGIAIKNNAFDDNHGGAIRFYYSERADQTIAGNWEQRGDPRFVRARGVPDPGKPDQYDFHPRVDSPLLDAGVFLTTTTSAGSGTALPVADASYFIDGYGLVPGDLLQLEGQPRTARIVGIDYARNRLTLDRALSWRAGQGVSLAYAGARPDIGAYERPAAARPSRERQGSRGRAR